MQIEAWGQTDKGLKRSNNQDAFLIDHELGLYIVADGMGGHRGGEVASQLAVATVKDFFSKARANKSALSPRELLISAIQQANAKVYEKSRDPKEELHGMGTTLVVLFAQASRVFIGNVGDSRCYLFASSLLWQMTEDHSLINDQIRSGYMNENQARKMMPKNVITRSVGYEPDVAPDVLERKLAPGEYCLLCSDGLSGMVPDERILQILLEEPVNKITDLLVEEAKHRGGDDNVTVVIVRAK